MGTILSVASGHADRAVRSRWARGYDRPHRGRGNARATRPAGHHRERGRRFGHDRRRPRRCRCGRGLYVRAGQLGDPRLERRHVRAALRSGRGFRAGGAGIERSAADRGAQEHASERLEGVHRVAEGQPGPGDPGYDRGGRHIDGRRPVFSKSNRHAVQVRPLSRRSRPRHAGSRRWPDRFHDRRRPIRCRKCVPAPSRPMR